MRYVEYGKENQDTIILLHGGGLSCWNYEEAAQSLQNEFHVVLPLLDGHAGSSKDFISIEDNACEIIEFIDANFGGSVLLLGGLSLGGQIALETLSQCKSICEYALIESARVIPSKMTHFIIAPVFGISYGLIRRKWFSRLQFKSLKIKEDLFEQYFRDTSLLSRKNMIAFLQANAVYSLKESIKNSAAKTHIFVGAKENNTMQKSAEMIWQAVPGSKLQVLPGLYHGEFSINHGRNYADKIRQIIAESF